MRVRPAERHLENPVHDIQRQVRAQIQATPDPRLGSSEVNPDPKGHDVRQRRSPQFLALRPRQLLCRCCTTEREVTEHLPEIIELGTADDRLEASEQFIALVLV
jgi:hypothetical protein